MVQPTVSPSTEKYAPITALLCPANVFGLNPSRGSNVKSLAVMSFEVVMKHLTTSHELETGMSWNARTSNQATTEYSLRRRDGQYTFYAEQKARTLERDGLVSARLEHEHHG